MENYWESKINELFSGESLRLMEKVWTVVVELEDERALLGQTKFKIPLYRKRFNTPQDFERTSRILLNLDSKGFISLGKDVRFDNPETEIELTDGFKYLYVWLERKVHPEKYKKKDEKELNFNWDAKPNEKRGILTVLNNKPMIFWSGNFGGVNELIKNIGHDCKRQQLKEAIAKYTQGSKSAKAINVSKWLYDLRHKRVGFFRYFKVEYFPPDNYKLLYIH